MANNRLRVRDIKVCPQDYDYAAVNSDETVCLYKDERARGDQNARNNQRLGGAVPPVDSTQMIPIAENKKSVKVSKLINSSLSINIISDY